MKKINIKFFSCLFTLTMLLFSGSMMAQTFTGTTGPVPATGTAGNAQFTATVPDLGNVGAVALIENVTINNMTHTFDGDLDISLIAPSGEVMLLSGGNGGAGDNYIGTVFANGTPPNPCIESGSPPFTGTFEPEGGLFTNSEGTCGSDFQFNTVFNGVATAGDWTLNIQDNFGGDSGNMSSWSITFGAACAINVPSPVTVDNDPGVCGANVTLVATAPGCADPLTNDQSAGGPDASGVYPVGTTTVTWTSGGSSNSTTVTVNDTEAPTLACPANQTIHLDPGACEQVLSYDVTATDNCPISGGSVSYTMNNDLSIASATTGLNCGNGNSISYLQVYDLPALGATTDLEVTSIDVVLAGNNAPGNVIANVYSIAAVPGTNVNFNYADLTLLGTNTFNYTPTFAFFTPTLATIPVTATIPAGTIVVLELVSTNDQLILAVNGAGLAPGGDSYVAGCIGAFANPTSIGNTGLAGIGQYMMGLNADLPSADPIQTAGIPSGEAYPIGTTTNTFEITDGAGNTVTCTWSVTVVENVPTSNDITCNDLVNISLDETCSAVVGADQILEGNNYGCYDNFSVTFAATGQPLILDGSHVGQTIEVMVTNPNGNPCWGYILVEDKIIPELECEDIEVTCADPTAPGSSFDARNDYAFPSLASQDNNTVTETVVVDAGTTVQDLDVAVSSTHTWVGDLVVSITSPAGTTVELFNNLGGPGLGCNNAAGQNLDVVLNDAAAATYADMDGQCPPVGEFQPLQALAAFNGENAQGTWTVSVQDLVGGDGGTVDVTLDLKAANSGTIDFPVPAGVTVIGAGPNTWTLLGFDPCGPATLTNVDVESGDLCDGTAQIERIWTVTDGSGNTTTCTEIITVTPTTLADVAADLPTNIELECGDVLPTPLTDIGCDNIGITLDGAPVIIDICEGSYKMLRKYVLVDWCDNSTLNYTQIIKVLDTGAPTIDPIADLTISTGSNNCLGSVQLPTVTATDACSSTTVTATSSSAGDLIGNTIQNLPVGTHTVTYTATDGCGNESTADLTIVVEDQIAPIAICDEFTIVGIGSDGNALVNAITFDDGSTDNCGITQMLVRRMDNPACPGFDGTPFAATVPFFCCDVNTTVMVEFQVRDAAGNVNSCMVEVAVQDKINPTVICAPDANIDCTADYLEDITVGQPLPQSAINANGEALASDNCPGVSLTNNVISNTIDCGVGTITIVWTATDAVDRTASCIQRYFVTNSDPFFINANNDLDPNDDVVWPLDYTATTCGTGLEPGDLLSPFNFPVLEDANCSNIAVGHQDQVLDFGAADACLKILRKWYVIDWCQATANQDPTQPGPGVWHYTQIIKVINSNDPNITVVDFPSVIDNFDADCGNATATFAITADDDCTAQADLDVSWEFSTGLSGEGFSASGAFANGSYSLTFTVNDQCGNNSTVEHNFTVVDAKKPTPVCIFGIATTVMPSSGAVTIWASDFESGSSFDNCTIYDNLQFSFSQNVAEDNVTITCADIPADGLFPVTIYVTDEAGNFDFCSTFVQVQDPTGACGVPTALINGTVENENQELIEEVTVTLSDNVGMNLPVVTGADGTYQFGMGYGAYDVTPDKDINYLNGVTTYDLVLIAKHILGTEVLDSPYKMIAADANKTNSITTLDIVKLRALILHIDDELANNSSWRFVDANHVFGTNVFDFPEYVALDGTTFDPVNFTAVKIGDVNGTASPNSLLGSDTRTFAGDLALSLEATQVAAGETFTVDFKANDFKNIAGYQFTLGFDHSVEFVDVTSNLTGLSAANFGLTKLAEGVITTSWNSNEGVTVANGEVLFSMTFRANAAVNTADLLSINSRYTESEAYNGSDLYNVVLEFNGNAVSNGFELFQNTPNPFKAETTIGFTMPTAGAATLTIYDVSGRVLRLIEVEAVKGFNSVNVSRAGIDATGVLYYQLETATETATKKMILVD